MNPAFVFYDQDKKRRKRIKGLIRAALFVFCAAFVFFEILYKSTPYINRADRKSFDEREVIDEISMKKEDVIEVEGTGGLVKILNKDGKTRLTREALPEGKRVLLTFDDGPDPIFTPLILDELKKEGIPAVFFVVGEQMIRHPQIVKRIVDEGHILGVHTYSHPSAESDDLYKNNKKAAFEIDITQKIMIALTGQKSTLFRVPNWGAEDTIELNTLVFISYAYNRGYDILSSTVDAFDWRESDHEKIADNVEKFQGSQIVLLHDSGGDRNSTIKAIPKIISAYKSKGYEFATANEITGVFMPFYQTPSIMDTISAQASYWAIWVSIYYLDVLKIVLTSGLGIVGGIMFLSILFANMQILKKRTNSQKPFFPFISVIVPAFNEEDSIKKNILSLLKSKYPRFEIIVVDNNSTDKTRQEVSKFLPNKKIKLINELTQGKYAAINSGIEVAKGHYIVIVDADTQISREALFHLVQPFRNKKIGAVAGYVKVGNVRNILTTFQSIEYIISQQIDRRAHDFFGTTLVIPGAIGAWRKEAVKKVGGYTNDTLTEDADITIRVQREGFKTAFASGALGVTEAPENLTSFFKQRQRWTFGILQVLYKNRDMILNQKYGFMGLFLIPSMVFFSIPSMIIAPFIEIIAYVTIVLNFHTVLVYFLLFIALYILNVSISFALARESKVTMLLYVPLMRIFYHFLWYINFYRCLFDALRGEYIPWNKMHHLGLVEIYPLNKSK